MSVQTEISRLESAKQAIATAIASKGVAVPSGTMLDGMAALIESIKGGGVSLDVLTASSLPATVTDGQIVVITDTTPGTVYIDTDEPASRAVGDVWIMLAAGGEAALVLTEESPYLRNGIKEAFQWAGTEWVPVDGYIGDAGNWKKFAGALPPVGTALNDLSWGQIAKISKYGKAADYFSVGDAKEIVISGTVGKTNFVNARIWAFIIGINHNPEHEGANNIHFQIGKSAQVNGTNLCLADALCDQSASEHGYFAMNPAGSNVGGWEGSPMRSLLNGNGATPIAPSSGTLLAALPTDLRSVMKGATKYTDNQGGGNDVASSVTKTTDYLWLLSEFELFGARTNANSAEKNYQKQYAYYASGNSKFFYRYNSHSTSCSWWLRSPAVTNSNYYCRINSSGVSNAYYSTTSRGVAPAFCV